MLKITRAEKNARIEVEDLMGRKTNAMLEDKMALSVVEGKLLKEGVLEGWLILGMREVQSVLHFCHLCHC